MCLVTTLRYGGVGLLATDTIEVLRYSDGRRRELRLGGKLRTFRGGAAAVTGRSAAMARLALNVLEREGCPASDRDACERAVQTALREHRDELLDAFPAAEHADTRVYILPSAPSARPYLIRADEGLQDLDRDALLGLPPDLELGDVEGLEAEFADAVHSAASVEGLLRAVADLFLGVRERSELISGELDFVVFNRQGVVRACRPAVELATATDDRLSRLHTGATT